MSFELLTQAGLTPTQAEILGYLLSQNDLKAKDLVSALDKPRGVIYKGLDELVDFGLVERVESTGKVARFRAEHPAKLEVLFEVKEKQIKKDKENFLRNLPEITASYEIANSKPNVHCYGAEIGQDKLKQMLIRSQTEVMVFTNGNDDLNYVCEAARVGYRRVRTSQIENQNNTLERSIDSQAMFKTSIVIFDKKISYLTIKNKKQVTVIIEDEDIYEMNRAMFEFLWQQAK